MPREGNILSGGKKITSFDGEVIAEEVLSCSLTFEPVMARSGAVRENISM